MRWHLLYSQPDFREMTSAPLQGYNVYESCGNKLKLPANLMKYNLNESHEITNKMLS